MRVVRFVDTEGNIRLARELDSGGVELLSGSLFDPADPIAPTRQTAASPSSLLSPTGRRCGSVAAGSSSRRPEG